MKPSQMIQTFTDRYPLIGPAFWILSLQYYLVQVISAQAWSMPYSVQSNTISDLGNTVCGLYAGRYVCSPLHSLMNASFITLGITMVVGAVLIYQEFKESKATFIGFTFMAIAGLGTLLVGLFPENGLVVLHVLGAALPFFVGNVGLIVLGASLDIPSMLRYYTLVSGIVSLTALLFFITHTYLGIGIGGMERLTAYPQTMWLIVFGIYISSNHIRLRAANNN
ncbi:DUF998 domain-containing protein [Candidatus Saccharibacteria bacterium]|nr:DUF998 domain-containing protein [Candidatus Saccharibacteria bacterium]